MCGICGIAGKKIAKYKSEGTVQKMNEKLSLRGPDEHDSAAFDNCLLAMSRLSIVDLSTGHQPMRDNAQAHTIVFNGEIYNYRELRTALEAKGYRFSTRSDTEVILKAYAEYGTDCPRHLDGMFAFAIWDEPKETLFIARDRFGKKPFYYTFDDDKNFIFASEIKAIFAAGIRGVVDPSVIDHYLQLGYVPPTECIYKNISVLPAAHSATIKDTVVTESCYWRLEKKPIYISYDDAKEKVRSLFNDAVRKRMVADVEIGSMLSGGVDSTLVTAYAQKYTNRPIKTFSVGFEDFINELPYAKQAAERIGTDHYELQTNIDLARELDLIADYFDEPNADASTIPTHMISKFARTKVKVLLSGDGGDEVFLGYGWYWKHHNLQKHKRLAQLIISNPFKDYVKLVSCFSPEDRTALWKSSPSTRSELTPLQIDWSGSKRLGSIERMNLYDFKMYLPGNLITKLDRASMMNSLEVRCPFLDHHLVEFVYNIPTKFKMNSTALASGAWSGKVILKDVLSEIMPKEFVERRKQGFGPPMKDWLAKKEIKALIEGLFISKEAEVYKLLNKDAVLSFITAFYEKGDARENATLGYKLWNLLCLELWYKKHKQYHA